MAYITKFDEKGELLVSFQPGSAAILVSKTKRIVEDFPIDVLHFINPEQGWSCWVLSAIRTSMLTDQGTSGSSFYAGSKSSGEPKPVQYRKPVYLYVHKIYTECGIILSDRDGNILSGSNIYDSGFGESKNQCLCLGSSWTPFGLEPVDFLLFNNANRDLSWRGDVLEGKWVDAKKGNSKIKVFEIERWPTYHKRYPIPREVTDAVDQLWPHTVQS